jgi:hypothetical protein
MTVPAILSVSGGPITASGTLAVTLATQVANVIFAGPTTGAAAAPTFRALVLADFANDLITYAKIQNVSATSRILGRVTAGAGDIEELTVAQVQTLLGYLDGALTAGRVPYASDANTLIDSGSLRFDGTRLAVGAGTQASFLDLFAGALSGTQQFFNASANVNGNMISQMLNASNVGAANTFWVLSVGGASAGDPFIQYVVATVGTWSAGIDNSDADKFKITWASTPGGVANSGLTITTGTVSNVGINTSSPLYPLDVAGRIRSTQYVATNAGWALGNVVAGTALGSGTITSVTGSANFFQVNFTVAGSPTANAGAFVVTFPTAFPSTAYPVFSARTSVSAGDMTKYYIQANSATGFTLTILGTLTAGSHSLIFMVGGLT